jgi:hypothetical protein
LVKGLRGSERKASGGESAAQSREAADGADKLQRRRNLERRVITRSFCVHKLPPLGGCGRRVD